MDSAAVNSTKRNKIIDWSASMAFAIRRASGYLREPRKYAFVKYYYHYVR